MELVYEKSTRQRFNLDISEQVRLGYEPETKLVVSCPQTLNCAREATPELNDDFVFQIYKSGTLVKEYEQWEDDEEYMQNEGQYMKPRYGTGSFYGRQTKRSVHKRSAAL